MSAPATLRLLLRVRTRRLKELEEQLKVRMQEQQECERQRDEAQAREQDCRDAEGRCVRKIFDVAEGGPFSAGDVVLLQHVLDTLKARTKEAAKALADAAQRLQEAIDAVAQARLAVHRSQSQLKLIEEKLAEALKEIERQQDDAQDEESEEAGVTRLLAARSTLRRSQGSKILSAWDMEG